MTGQLRMARKAEGSLRLALTAEGSMRLLAQTAEGSAPAVLRYLDRVQRKSLEAGMERVPL